MLQAFEEGTTFSIEESRENEEDTWRSRFDADATPRESEARVEFERFQDNMRQRKEFKTMVDKEASRELAKQ